MTNIIVLNYNDQEVTFDSTARMWSLNAMHEACGGAENKAPWRWMETEQAKEFAATLCAKLNLAKNEVYETRRGRYGMVTIVRSHPVVECPCSMFKGDYKSPLFLLPLQQDALRHLRMKAACLIKVPFAQRGVYHTPPFEQLKRMRDGTVQAEQQEKQTEEVTA